MEFRQLSMWTGVAADVFRLTDWRTRLRFCVFDKPWWKALVVVNLILEEQMKRQSGVREVGKAKADPGYTTFVNFTIGAEAEEGIREKFPTIDSSLDALQIFLERGYRVGFSSDFQRGSVICALTCRDTASKNSGKTMTSFASTWLQALNVAAFKHFYLLEEDWSTVSEAENRPLFG